MVRIQARILIAIVLVFLGSVLSLSNSSAADEGARHHVSATDAVETPLRGAPGQDAKSEPEMVMMKFLQAFVAYDYETCRTLLAPGATITITRHYPGGEYQSAHQDAREWLDQVAATGVKGIEDFAVDIHETAGLRHTHGATAVLRFTSTGMTGKGMFVNTGFDTGSLIETPDGWLILHYSSFENFSWGAAEPQAQD